MALHEQRVESQLPSTFYSMIDSVPNDLWMKYVRYLGLNEGDIINVSGRDRGLQEKKYQILNRWKMYIGVVSDREITDILKKTMSEINSGPSFTCDVYPPAMKKNIKRARTIYGFIENYERENWPHVARMQLGISDNDFKRIRNAYDDDEIEKRYQMVLAWMRVQQLEFADAKERLQQLRGRPLTM